MVFEPINIEDVEVPKISYGEWILRQYRKRAAEGKTALVWADKGTQISFADLLRDAVRVATGLKAMGVKSGDTISVVAKNSPELFPFVIGCIFADIQIAPSVTELSANELKSNFETVKPKYILTRPEKAPVIEEAISDFNPRPEIILLDEKTFQEILSKGSHANPDTFQTAPVEDPLTHVFAYMFSSGTTGKQKAIMQSDYYFLKASTSCAALFAKHKGLFFSASQLNWISWFYLTTRTVLADRTWLFTTATDVESLLGFIKKYRPTTYLCAPAVIYAIRNAIKRQPGRWDISSIKEIMTGGDRFGPEIQKDFTERFNIKVYQEYGSTEVGLVSRGDLDEDPIYGSAGKLVLPIRLVDPDTEEEITERNKVGEIRVKTIVMTGYLGNPEGTAEAFDKQGWCKTGDLGYVDENNDLFIVDRIKEMLKYKGFQVVPNELEEIIRLIPGVADAAIAGKHDDVAGSFITAFVVKEPGANITENDIKNYMAKRDLHDAKKLRGGVIFVDELPKNSNGKIQRRKLVEILNNTPAPKNVD